MSEQRTPLTGLEARKQMLVAEAELQRAHLREDLDVIQDAARSFGARLQSMAVAGAVALAGLSAFRQAAARSTGGTTNGKASWISKIWTGARLATTFWSAWRSRAR